MDKAVGTDEPDPQAIAARADDEPGSFLALYRSLSATHTNMDECVVRGSVDCGVIPSAIRYGILQRGNIEVYRGVVKSTRGDLFYFSWAPDTDFKLVKADDQSKVWDASRLFKACRIGCDLRRSMTAPLDPGETVEEASKEGTEFEDEETDKGAVPIPSAAQAPLSEERYMEQQESDATQHHPGSTASQMPEDDNTGRDWHSDIARSVTRPGDAIPGLGTTTDAEGQPHWTAVQLLKSWGQRMQATAPRLAPPVGDLETRYMTEVLGASQDEIRRGIPLAPRHRLAFQQWRTQQLRGRLAGLENFIKSNQ
jgi:hypothetical protein